MVVASPAMAPAQVELLLLARGAGLQQVHLRQKPTKRTAQLSPNETVQNSVLAPRRKDLIFSKLRMLKIRLTQNAEYSPPNIHSMRVVIRLNISCESASVFEKMTIVNSNPV